MRRNILAALSTALLGAAFVAAPTAVAPSALAQDATQSSPQAAATASGAYARIQPYVNAETFAVARIAPSQLSLDAIGDKLIAVFAESAEIRGYDPDALAACLAEFKTTLKGAKKFAQEPLALLREKFGLSEIFFVTPSLEEPGFFAYLPLDASKRELVAEFFEDETPFEPIEVAGGLIVGTPNFDADYFEEFDATPNPRLQAFLNGSDATVQAYVAEFDVRESLQLFVQANGDDVILERFDEALAQAPQGTRDALDAFDESFQSATLELDVNRLRVALRWNFDSEEAAQTVRNLQQSNVEASLDALEELFREEADEEVVELAENYRLIPLARELARGYATSSVLRLDGAALSFEFELGPSLQLTNPFLLTAAGFFTPHVNTANLPRRRTQTANQLKNLGLAAALFTDITGAFPARYTVDAAGQPLHSWRVLLLPYLEQRLLYDQIRLDEPWDSEWNSQFHDQTPSIYARPGGDPSEGCFFSCVADKSALLQPAKTANELTGLGFASCLDGATNTILFVERNEPVCWMDPNADLTLEEFLENAAHPENSENGINAVMCDCSVRSLSDLLPPEVLKAMVTRDGGEVVW